MVLACAPGAAVIGHGRDRHLPAPRSGRPAPSGRGLARARRTGGWSSRTWILRRPGRGARRTGRRRDPQGSARLVTAGSVQCPAERPQALVAVPKGRRSRTTLAAVRIVVTRRPPARGAGRTAPGLRLRRRSGAGVAGSRTDAGRLPGWPGALCGDDPKVGRQAAPAGAAPGRPPWPGRPRSRLSGRCTAGRSGEHVTVIAARSSAIGGGGDAALPSTTMTLSPRASASCGRPTVSRGVADAALFREQATCQHDRLQRVFRGNAGLVGSLTDCAGVAGAARANAPGPSGRPGRV